jgi:hypothetical protein
MFAMSESADLNWFVHTVSIPLAFVLPMAGGDSEERKDGLGDG